MATLPSRLIALFLASCLVCDPAMAGCLSPRPAAPRADTTLYATQALIQTSWIARPLQWIKNASALFREQPNQKKNVRDDVLQKPLGSTIRLSNNRQLGYMDYGSGVPVFYMPSWAGSRLEHAAQMPEIARRLGLRVIVIDPPGTGLTSALHEKSVAEISADIKALMDALQIKRVILVGYSLGGVSAAAIAEHLGDRVITLNVVSSPAPTYSLREQRVYNSHYRAILYLMTHHPLISKLILAPLFKREILTHWPRYVRFMKSFMAEDDIRLLAQDGRLEEMHQSAIEAVRQGGVSALRRFMLGFLDWGFSSSHIRAVTYVWHGQDDRIVPVVLGQQLAASIPHAAFTPLPGLGHFFINDRLEDILSAASNPHLVLDEDLARYVALPKFISAQRGQTLQQALARIPESTDIHIHLISASGEFRVVSRSDAADIVLERGDQVSLKRYAVFTTPTLSEPVAKPRSVNKTPLWDRKDLSLNTFEHLWRWVYAIPGLDVTLDSLSKLLMHWNLKPKKPVNYPIANVASFIIGGIFLYTLFFADPVALTEASHKAHIYLRDVRARSSKPDPWLMLSAWSVMTGVNFLFRGRDRNMNWSIPPSLVFASFGEALATIALFAPVLWHLPFGLFLGIGVNIILHVLIKRIQESSFFTHEETMLPVEPRIAPPKAALPGNTKEPLKAKIRRPAAVTIPPEDPRLDPPTRIGLLEIIRADRLNRPVNPKIIKSFAKLSAHPTQIVTDREIVARLQRPGLTSTPDFTLRNIWFITFRGDVVAAFIISDQLGAHENMNIVMRTQPDFPYESLSPLLSQLLKQILELSQQQRGFVPKWIIVHGNTPDIASLARELNVTKDNPNGHLRIPSEHVRLWNDHPAPKLTNILPFTPQRLSSFVLPLKVTAGAHLLHTPWMYAFGALFILWIYQHRSVLLPRSRAFLAAA